jgi:DNA replication protein DnaC
MTVMGAMDMMPEGTTSGTPQVLLGHHLKQLKLPTVLREYDKVARECARDGVDHPRYLLRLVERRIRQARFPATKSFDTFDFTAIPGLNKMLVLDLASCEFILRRENVIALGNSGTGKTHLALALGLAACQKGLTVAFPTAAALVHQLMEARDERRLLKLQRELQAVKLLIVDELGYVPLSPIGAELLFAVFSQRYEARLHHRHFKPALRGMDLGPGIGAAHRRAARSADPPRSYPGHERRQLSSQAIRRPPPGAVHMV